MTNPKNKISMEELTSYAKRRGFVFQASEIYGGLGGFWDLGPYGAELADNIKASWWKEFVYKNANVVGVNTTIIQNPKLWKASGHIDTFVDPMVDCKECKHRFRADQYRCGSAGCRGRRGPGHGGGCADRSATDAGGGEGGQCQQGLVRTWRRT